MEIEEQPLKENDISKNEMPLDTKPTSEGDKKRETSWPSVLFYIHLHTLGFYGLFAVLTSASWLTIIFTFILTALGILGATAGAHRLWAHGAYNATTSLKVFLMLCQTLVGQGSIYNWVRLHRLHHEKFGQPEDPYYSNRDFLRAHVYAQVLSRTADQEALLAKIDMSDLEEDKVVMFQKRFYWILFVVLHVLLPINTPLADFGETLGNSIFVSFSLRYMIVSNICWLINSCHFIWGLDKNFRPADSNSVFFITKTYWPQYHYMLSNDYQCGEFGNYGIGFTTSMIRVFAALDLATDLKTITCAAVRNGLTEAVETGNPVVDCIQKHAKKEMEAAPNNHYLNREKFM
ncbi:acyl-CoA Delta(11) desaturase [Glossina fuscipes]|uniref:Acyl-CoA Delta(11) desaturase n=1 Tax=Glossina fuscipes TaxID=7396 RepID=A0A9C6DX47_9MUSC|nr:acyl-CoA Delta(11) desaturase [Glossina fuscipes]